MFLSIFAKVGTAVELRSKGRTQLLVNPSIAVEIRRHRSEHGVAAVNKLINMGIADPRRVAVMGHSHCGYSIGIDNTYRCLQGGYRAGAAQRNRPTAIGWSSPVTPHANVFLIAQTPFGIQSSL
jgi:hypothetical protein